MRRIELMLMRHGKAVRDGGADIDRRLRARGRVEVARVAARVVERDLTVERILYSASARTTETARIFAAVAAPEAAMQAAEALYLCSAETLWRRAVAAFADVDRLLIVGHNPAISLLASTLCGETPLAEMKTSDLMLFMKSIAVGEPLSLDRWTPIARINQAGVVDEYC